jgi:hypothetical protein
MSVSAGRAGHLAHSRHNLPPHVAVARRVVCPAELEEGTAAQLGAVTPGESKAAGRRPWRRLARAAEAAAVVSPPGSAAPPRAARRILQRRRSPARCPGGGGGAMFDHAVPQPWLHGRARLERALELTHPTELRRLLARRYDLVLVLRLRLEVTAHVLAVRPAETEEWPE